MHYQFVAANFVEMLKIIIRKIWVGEYCQTSSIYKGHLTIRSTVLKFKDFSAIQVLREIILKTPKTANSTILAALNLEFLMISDIFKCGIIKNETSKPSKLLKWQL